jgi:hypothetical protein
MMHNNDVGPMMLRTLPGMILFSAGWKGFEGTSAPNDQFDLRSSGPLRCGIVVGMDMRDSGVHNYPPRWNAAPSQELLVIRRNHDTGVVSLDPLRWGLIPHWCQDPKGGRKPINAKCETVDRLPMFRDAYRRRRCILRHTYLWGYRAINTMEEPNGQEWEIEQEGTPEQKDKEIDESRREEAA